MNELRRKVLVLVDSVDGREALATALVNLFAATVRQAMSRNGASAELNIKNDGVQEDSTDIAQLRESASAEMDIKFDVVGGGLGGSVSGSALVLSQIGPSQQIRKDRRSIAAALPADFVVFWSRYPLKVGKTAALRAWHRAHPPLDKCLAALEWQVFSDAWTKDGGAFVPHPATWINAGRWDDEKPAARLHLTAKTRSNIASGEEWLAMHGVKGKP